MQGMSNPALRAGAWMLLAIASFASIAVAARQVSGTIPVFEILAWRSLIGLLIIAAFMRVRGDRFYSGRPGLQLVRNVVHFAGQYCWTLGVISLPLAQVFALEFTTPVWVALLAALLLGERLSRARLVAIMGGFIGVLIVVHPGFSGFNPYLLVVLAAAWFFAGSVLLVKKLTATDSAVVIVFYMTLVQLPIGLVLAWPDWVTPGWVDVPWLVIFAIGGLSAHLGLTQALAIADASFVLPMDYLRLPLIALIGFVVYAEKVDLWLICGALIIMASNYYSLRMERRRLRALVDAL